MKKKILSVALTAGIMLGLLGGCGGGGDEKPKKEKKKK